MPDFGLHLHRLVGGADLAERMAHRSPGRTAFVAELREFRLRCHMYQTQRQLAVQCLIDRPERGTDRRS